MNGQDLIIDFKKVCPRCQEEKPISLFSRNQKRCKECDKRYREKRKEIIKAYNKKYWIENRPKQLAYLKNYQQINKKTLRKKANAKERYRLATDPDYKIRKKLKTRLYFTVKESGNASHASKMSLIGCTIEFFKNYLQKQFDSKMTWENYGSYWVIDHYIPVAFFDMTSERDVKTCFHWSNLRPLSGIENRKKGYKLSYK